MRSSRRFWLLVTVLVALPWIFGAKGCSESEQCKAAKAAEAAVCPAAPDSASCLAAKQAVEELCRPDPEPTPAPTPTPVPTPTPTPTPVPVNLCKDHPDLCVDGSVCVDTPMGPVCEPGPEPTPTPGCSIDGEPGPLIPDRRPELGDVVNEAMHALRPDCDPGGRCELTEGRQAWQGRVVAELRRRGVCAGQHQPDTDEIAAATSDRAPREGWHVYAGPWDGPGTVVWAPQAARPAYAAPGPVVPPGCGEPVPPDLADFNLHCIAGRAWPCDATPIVHGCGYKGPGTNFCRDIGLGTMPGGGLVRCDCPAGNEDNPAKRTACEREVIGRPGPPADAMWRSDGAVEVNPSNHLQARCSECAWIAVCKADGTQCTRTLLSGPR